MVLNNSKHRFELILTLVLLTSAISLSFDQRNLDHRYKTDDGIVFYDFVYLNDSTFMIGDVIDKKTKDPLVGLNIVVLESGIGTVTEPAGNFKIFLPRKKGELRFFFGARDFTMPFEFDPEELNKNNTTHH